MIIIKSRLRYKSMILPSRRGFCFVLLPPTRAASRYHSSTRREGRGTARVSVYHARIYHPRSSSIIHRLSPALPRGITVVREPCPSLPPDTEEFASERRYPKGDPLAPATPLKAQNTPARPNK